MRTRAVAVVLGVSLVLMTAPLYAHDSGASFEQDVGAYKIDLGYDTERFVAGERTVFDFELLDTKGGSVSFERVWVRISEGSTVVLATGVGEAPVGKTTLLHRFSKEAPLEGGISVRFEGKDSTLAETAFPFSIAPPLEKPLTTPLWVTVLAAMCGAALGATAALFRRR